MQQELIEMLEKLLNWYDYIGSDSYYAKDTGKLTEEADALIKKAKKTKNNAPAVQGEPVAYIEKITGRLCAPLDEHRLKFPMCYEPLCKQGTAACCAARVEAGSNADHRGNARCRCSVLE